MSKKKKWTLVILFLLLLAGWYKLFYKSWNNKSVSKNADIIIAIDVKKITNTLIWQFITTPSQWNKVSVFSSSDVETVSWEDMISLPDYVFIFHSKNHPGNAFYAVVEINDKEDFEKGLRQYHFEKTKYGSYISKETGVELLQNGNKLLLANAAIENKLYIQLVAKDLFHTKEYIAEDELKKNIEAVSHLSVQVKKNDFLSENTIIAGNFDKTKIDINADLLPQKKFVFTENIFSYNDTSLLSLGFTQPSSEVYKLLSIESRASLTRLLNFNIDSMLLPGNTFYQLAISGIKQRADSAVSYTYDDNFNPVEKKIADTLLEPAYHFTIAGKDADKVYNFWNANGKLEQTDEGKLFTLVPFVKSYCNFLPELVTVSPHNYSAPPKNKTTEAILFFNLLFSKIPPELVKYFPQAIQNGISNIESVNVIAQKNNAHLKVRCIINKKKVDLPWVE